jgi:acid phosphatase family membrane protein YuiD
VAIVVPIVADTSGLTKGLSQGGSRLKKFGKIAAVAAGAAAIGGLVKTLQIGTQKFVAQEKAVAQTNARLKSTGGIANVTARQVMKLSDAIAEKTGVDDDQIHAASNMLLTFTKIRNEVGKNNDIFNRATETVVDLSIAFDKDLGSTSIMLGKALNDPVKGITALSRAGVQFTENQKKTIKSLVESGNVLGAQKMILKELETQVGGAGEAFGNTLPGQLSKAKQSFEVIAQSLAGLFLPTVANALKRLTGFLSEFGKQPTLRAKVLLVIDKIRDATGKAFRDLYTWWTTTQRIELPARVVIIPSGAQQFDLFFANLEKKANLAGRRTAGAFVGAFSEQCSVSLIA